MFADVDPLDRSRQSIHSKTTVQLPTSETRNTMIDGVLMMTSTTQDHATSGEKTDIDMDLRYQTVHTLHQHYSYTATQTPWAWRS